MVHVRQRRHLSVPVKTSPSSREKRPKRLTRAGLGPEKADCTPQRLGPLPCATKRAFQLGNCHEKIPFTLPIRPQVPLGVINYFSMNIYVQSTPIQHTVSLSLAAIVHLCISQFLRLGSSIDSHFFVPEDILSGPLPMVHYLGI